MTSAALIENSIPQFNGQSAEWIEWHKNLKARYGKKEANSMWMAYWKYRGNSKANTSELRTYMSNNGLKIDSSAWDKVVDLEHNVVDSIGGIFKVSMTTQVIVTGVVLASVGFIIYSVMSKPDKYAIAVGKGAKYVI